MRVCQWTSVAISARAEGRVWGSLIGGEAGIPFGGVAEIRPLAMPPPSKSVDCLGTVAGHGNGWRARAKMDGRNVDGPQRATQSEARTDLERARQCKSRTEMSKYLALLAQQVRNAATNNATTTGSGNAELAAATGHESNQRRPQGR